STSASRARSFGSSPTSNVRQVPQPITGRRSPLAGITRWFIFGKAVRSGSVSARAAAPCSSGGNASETGTPSAPRRNRRRPSGFDRSVITRGAPRTRATSSSGTAHDTAIPPTPRVPSRVRGSLLRALGKRLAPRVELVQLIVPAAYFGELIE